MLWGRWSQSLDNMLDDALAELHGTPHADDDVVLDQLGRSIMDSHAIRLLGHRQLAKQQRGLVPAEQSILKLMGSEAQQDLAALMLESLGASALDQTVDSTLRFPYETDRGAVSWSDRYLFTFAGTISGGTSEIQRNIVAERVLGLPRG